MLEERTLDPGFGCRVRAARPPCRAACGSADRARCQSVVTNFRINTNTESADFTQVPWRADEIAFDAAFPHRANLIVAVLDGATPEIADEAAEQLAAALAAKPALVEAQPAELPGRFFETYGLLLMPQAELERVTDTLIRQQGLLGPLAADPTLHGIDRDHPAGARRRPGGQVPAAEVAKPFDKIATTIEAVLAGQPARAVVPALAEPVVGWTASPRDTRRFLLVQPVLDFNALTPAGATDRLHPRRGPAAEPDAGAWRPVAPHRTGAAGGRGVRHRRRERRAQQHRDDRRDHADPVPRLAFAETHHRGADDQPCAASSSPPRWARDGRAAQPDLGGVRRAVRRARRRFRHPGRGAVPRRALSRPRRAEGAGRRGGRGLAARSCSRRWRWSPASSRSCPASSAGCPNLA